MHFEAEYDFQAARDAVAAVLCDPKFHTTLDLPDLSRPEVVEASADGTERLLRLRYEFVGHIDPIAQKVVGGRKLTWLQDLRFDTATWSGTLTFAAEADPKRLSGQADVALEAVDGDAGTRRRIAGDLHVRVPLLGGTAERKIVPGLVRRLGVEAEAAAKELARRS